MNVLSAGGCQCGRIRYEIKAQPLTIYACHCQECQKQSSSAFGMSMPVPREAVAIVKGQPKEWTRRSESGREVICLFCRDCGTRLFHQPTRNPKIINIKPGTLDDTSWLQPIGNAWTRSAQRWVHISEQMLNYEGQPDDFSQLFERWRLINNSMSYTIAELNQMSQEAFVEALGAVFEHTPAIARQAWNLRPFTDVTQLHQTMVDVANTMNREEQLALIRAHPDLGSKAKMAEASVKEQAGVGLDRMTSQEYDRFHLLNQAYKDKFGFPFIVAVKNHTKNSILDAFDRRLENTAEIEVRQALTEITQIARFRLVELIKE